MSEEKSKKNKDILIWKHPQKDIQIKRDAYNYIVTIKKRSCFYPSLSPAIQKISDTLLVEKFADISDDEKTSLVELQKTIKEHVDEMREMFGAVATC